MWSLYPPPESKGSEDGKSEAVTTGAQGELKRALGRLLRCKEFHLRFANRYQIWATTSTSPVWASVLTGKLSARFKTHRNVNCSQGEELSCPNPARWSALERPCPSLSLMREWACHWRWIAPILTPLREKSGGSRHIKRVRKQLRDTLIRRVAGPVEQILSNLIHQGTASWGATLEATQGGCQPCGLGACDKCSQRHDGLAWSGPNRRWNRKYGQEPDGPAFERNPMLNPQNTLLGVCSETKSTNVVEWQLTHSWNGPEWANRPGSWAHKCPGASKGQSSIHAFCEHPLRQGQAKGKNLYW